MVSIWNVSHREPFAHGIELFNQQRFFDAHEQLEDAWRAETGEARLFLQGMTQVAVALHHYSTGNRAGATSVLARALRNLRDYPERYAGIELGRLRQELRSFHAGLAEGASSSGVPQITICPPNNKEQAGAG